MNELEVLKEEAVMAMNIAINLRTKINDTSITMKEYQPIKLLLSQLENLTSDIVSISINLENKLKENKQ